MSGGSEELSVTDLRQPVHACVRAVTSLIVREHPLYVMKAFFWWKDTWSSDPSDYWRQRNGCSFMLSIQHVNNEESCTTSPHPVVPRFYDNISQ